MTDVYRTVQHSTRQRTPTVGATCVSRPGESVLAAAEEYTALHAQYCCNNPARVRCVAELSKIDPCADARIRLELGVPAVEWVLTLPGAQIQLAIGDGDGYRRAD